MRAIEAVVVACALALAVGVAPGAHGEPPPAKDWEVEILAYGWLPRFDVEVELPNGTTADVEMSMGDVLDDLDFAAMGRVAARWRRFVLAADGIWTDFGQDARFERGPVRIDGDFDQKLAMVQLLGGYRVFSREGGLFGTATPGDRRRFGADVLAGANYWYVSADASLRLAPVGPFAGGERHFGASSDWVGPAVGLRFQNDFTERIRFETLAVASGFGAGDAPDMSWQLTTLLSYRFTDHWLVSIGHRLLTADDAAGFESDIRMHGPMLGVGYRF